MGLGFLALLGLLSLYGRLSVFGGGWFGLDDGGILLPNAGLRAGSSIGVYGLPGVVPCGRLVGLGGGGGLLVFGLCCLGGGMVAGTSWVVGGGLGTLGLGGTGLLGG